MPDDRLQARKMRSLSAVLVGTLASTLVNLLSIFPAPGLAESILGVVRSSDNSADWIKITTRLWESGIAYKPINLEDIKSAADLVGVSVIFLPNIETLSAVQVKALEDWVKQGGRLIAAGPVGRNSPALVRQSLRSLLGAYWAFPLTRSASLQPRLRCRDIACNVSSNWVPPEQANVAIKGGVLIPADVNSQTVAIWRQSDGSSAAIASDRATYLGWRWGTDGAANLDTAWLRASLARWGGTVSPTPNIAIAPPNSRGSAPVPAPNPERISRSPSPSSPPSPPS
ncbi:MAG TPA: hypothetical protein VK211_14895, partial [Kamptonema sp.]|nr:hypothetical protein [Kamptonema sp.]